MQPLVDNSCFILKLLIKRLNLFLRVMWKQMIDSDTGRRYQDRFGIRNRLDVLQKSFCMLILGVKALLGCQSAFRLHQNRTSNVSH